MQKARGHTVASNIVLPLLVSRRFQVLFHSGPPVLFTFPSRYWFTIGYRLVFSLRRWSSWIPTGFHVSRGTRGTPRVLQDFVYRAITVYGRPFHAVLLSIRNPTLGPHNPGITVVTPVWAVPRSLAATYGISFDFYSYRYLDVSVPCVRLVHLCIQCTMTGHNPCRVSPFGNLRVKACLAAYRSLSQLTTSFIASRCQGIHHAPLVA